MSKGAFPGGNNKKVEPSAETGDIIEAYLADLDPSATFGEIFHQRRQVDAIIDSAARAGKITLKDDRLWKPEMVVVAEVVAVTI